MNTKNIEIENIIIEVLIFIFKLLLKKMKTKIKINKEMPFGFNNVANIVNMIK